MKPCTLFIAFLVIPVSQADAASFIGLGGYGIGPNSQHLSVANSVSGNSQIVAGWSALPSGGSTAVYWDAAGLIYNIGDLPGGNASSSAHGISSNGSVIVGRSDSVNSGSGLPEAFRWSSNTGSVGIGFLGGVASQANAVSASGSHIVGWSWRDSQSQTSEAFLWTESGGMVGLGDLGGGRFLSEATDISDDGSVIVGFSESDDGVEAFRWTQGTGMQGLGTLFGSTTFGSRADAISADGSTIVGNSNFSQNGGHSNLAFLHTVAGGMISLGSLSGGSLGSSHAWDVSSDGRVVVGTSGSDNGHEAFIWTADQGMRNLEDVLMLDYGLDLMGWDLQDAFSISDDGRVIVGGGYNPEGNYEAFVVNLATIPVPAATWLFGTGLLGLIGFARRKSA